eukprot:425896_1
MTPQYHRLIAASLTELGKQIAGNMYNTISMQQIEEKDDDDIIAETNDIGNFFLFDYWLKSDSPLVLLNQYPLRASVKHTPKKDLDENKGDVKLDIDDAKQKEQVFGCEYTLLSYDLSKTNSGDAKEWKVIGTAFKKFVSWDVYNFSKDQNQQNQSVYGGFEEKQKQKLSLLLRLCGGFESPNPNKQRNKVDELYEKHSDYALTFDNV